VALVTAVALCIAFFVLAMIGNAARDGRSGAQSDAARTSIAVLPFLDLTTEEMNKEYFADGMTGELIDRLSQVPGFRVPPPTASRCRAAHRGAAGACGR